MAKGEARGWRKFIPSGPTVVKVFVVLVVIKVLNRVLLPQVPANVAAYWPAF